MKLTWYIGTSTVAAVAVVVSAFHQRANFYSAMVYLSQSNICLIVITNFVFMLYAGLVYGLQRLCYGPLRPVEAEQLYEKAWFAVTETCLAMTIFRDEIGVSFMAMFSALITGKVWGWIGDGRVEVLEQQPPANPWLFHSRLSVSLLLSVVYDALLLRHAAHAVIRQARPNMMVMFLFEFAVLATSSARTGMRYLINVTEHAVVRKQTRQRLEERRKEVRRQRADMIRRREEGEGGETGEELPNEEDVDEMDIEVPGWESKGQWVLGLDLAADLIKMAIYTAFFFILLTFYGLPIHILRDLFLTARSLLKRLTALLRYRRALNDMNNIPDATEEDLARENTCIICREEMRAWDPINGSNVERTRPKKLRCGHILHLGCLKSWLERQQVCPTCRRSVVVTERRDGARPNQNAGQNQILLRMGFGGQQAANGGRRLGGEGNNGQGGQQQNDDGNGENGGMRVFNLGPIRLAFAQGEAANLQRMARRMGGNGGGAAAANEPAAPPGGQGGQAAAPVPDAPPTPAGPTTTTATTTTTARSSQRRPSRASRPRHQSSRAGGSAPTTGPYGFGADETFDAATMSTRAQLEAIQQRIDWETRVLAEQRELADRMADMVEPLDDLRDQVENLPDLSDNPPPAVPTPQLAAAWRRRGYPPNSGVNSGVPLPPGHAYRPGAPPPSVATRGGFGRGGAIVPGPMATQPGTTITALTTRPGAGGVLNRNMPLPHSVAQPRIPAGSSDLPAGLTLPPGWSLMPLQRVNNRPGGGSGANAGLIRYPMQRGPAATVAPQPAGPVLTPTPTTTVVTTTAAGAPSAAGTPSAEEDVARLHQLAEEIDDTIRRELPTVQPMNLTSLFGSLGVPLAAPTAAHTTPLPALGPRTGNFFVNGLGRNPRGSYHEPAFPDLAAGRSREGHGPAEPHPTNGEMALAMQDEGQIRLLVAQGAMPFSASRIDLTPQQRTAHGRRILEENQQAASAIGGAIGRHYTRQLMRNYSNHASQDASDPNPRGLLSNYLLAQDRRRSAEPTASTAAASTPAAPPPPGHQQQAHHHRHPIQHGPQNPAGAAMQQQQLFAQHAAEHAQQAQRIHADILRQLTQQAHQHQQMQMAGGQQPFFDPVAPILIALGGGAAAAGVPPQHQQPPEPAGPAPVAATPATEPAATTTTTIVTTDIPPVQPQQPQHRDELDDSADADADVGASSSNAAVRGSGSENTPTSSSGPASALDAEGGGVATPPLVDPETVEDEGASLPNWGGGAQMFAPSATTAAAADAASKAGPATAEGSASQTAESKGKEKAHAVTVEDASEDDN